MQVKNLALLAATALDVSALALLKRAACSSYTIIDTRGTGEAQGPSAGFQTMNSNILSQVSGGTEYDTVYPAGADQDSSAGTQDIINKITSTLASNPNECFILEGYSQGAAATVNAMSQITGSAFDAVKGVFLIGDPEHRSGLACNVDNNGGTTTRDVNGLSASLGGIPSNWISKTLDVCIYGDGVCDTTHGTGINAQHLQYPGDAPTQNLGTNFVVGQLQSGGSSTSTGNSSTPSGTATSPAAAQTSTPSLGGGSLPSLPSLGGSLPSLPSLGAISFPSLPSLGLK